LPGKFHFDLFMFVSLIHRNRSSLKMTKLNSYEQIYETVKQIPEGKVATYGQIAELSGLAGKARVVGYALYQVDLPTSSVPWHRVINAKGEVSYSPLRRGADYLQRSLLEAEGIIFDRQGKVSLAKYGWRINTI
jgi:methylated-DNA-protein-cysteine methyltransferase related protein